MSLRQISNGDTEGGRLTQDHRIHSAPPLALVLSIESASSLLRISSMLNAVERTSSHLTTTSVSSLLFASEDFCHSAGIIRTRSRRELLFPRQQMNLIAKAYGLSAIDMVCIDYKDDKYLEEECIDGHELGFDGKQAVSCFFMPWDRLSRVFSY